MAIKMSCLSPCKRDAKFVCFLCEQLFCRKHGEKHFKKLDHAVQMANENAKSNILYNKTKKALKSEKRKRIHQITLNTSLIISNLQQVAQMQITSAKEANNLENLGLAKFGSENHLMYLVKAGIINEGIYYISANQFAELTSDWNQKIEEINELRGLNKSLEVANAEIETQAKQKTILCDKALDQIKKLEAEKAKVIENLQKIEAENKKQVEKRNQEESKIQVIKSNQEQNKLRVVQGTNYKGFNQMSIDDKKRYCKQNWSFFRTGDWTRELLLSNDGKYIFHCKFQLGSFEADYRNLKGSW